MDVTVRMTGVEKSYGPVRVLDVPRLELHGGQVVGLVGENGAGKSTLIGVLTGTVAPDAGEVTIGGARLRGGEPGSAQRLGVALAAQEFPLVGQLSVAENLLLNQRPPGAGRIVVNRAAHRRAARTMLDRLGLRRLGIDIPLDRRVELLPVPQRQLVEIAKAMGRDPRVLVLDEPTSALGPVESAAVLRVAREYARAGGVVVFIGHRLDEVRQVADRLVVMRNGRIVADLDPEAATEERLIREMVGAELSELVGEPAAAASTEVVLSATGLRADGLGPVDLEVRAGEILGVAGLMGSGRSRLLHTVMGAQPRTGGKLRLAGRAYAPRSPADAVAAGVALVPEDRKSQALLLDAPVRWNVSLAALRRICAAGVVLRPRTEQRFAREATASARVRCRTPEQPVRALSGGNQQRAVFGRWFATQPRLLLLDEPTRGVDVGAKAEIYRLIEQAAAEGAAVIVASSELEELMRLAHRIAVMSRGRVAAVLERAEYRKETIMTAAAIGRTT